MAINNKQESRIYTDNNRPVTFTPSKAEAVTPSDTTVFQPGSLYVGTGGTLRVMLADDTATVDFVNIPDGTFLPILVKMVYSTGLVDADNILVVR